MAKRMTIMLILAGIVFGGIYGYKNYEAGATSRTTSLLSPPVQRVSVTTAKYHQRTLQLRAVGTIQAVRGVDISSQLAGTVAAIHFDSGAEVRKGALLVELTAIDEIAKLHALMATAALSKLTYERDLQQLRVQSVSQQRVDTSRETLKRDEALVDQQRAVIDLKSIRAPFSGVLGIRRVNLGQYLEAGTPIVTLQALDSVYLDFSIPQRAISRIKIGQKIVARVDTYPEREIGGTISAINSSVDLNSRNVHVRATVENADHSLLPGMFSAVEIDTGVIERGITVPQTAVKYQPYGNTVFVAECPQKDSALANPIVREVAVTTGDARGDLIDVLSGLEEGQIIITAGQNTLVNGTPVLIDNSIAQSSNPAPIPVDY